MKLPFMISWMTIGWLLAIVPFGLIQGVLEYNMRVRATEVECSTGRFVGSFKWNKEYEHYEYILFNSLVDYKEKTDRAEFNPIDELFFKK